MAPEIATGRVVVAHLGNGASLCALDGGRSIDSTMGYTAIDGLIMGTRCGALDAGVVLDLIARRGMTVAEVEKSSTASPACSACPASPTTCAICSPPTNREAAEAISVFVRRIAKELGGLTAMLGGLDAWSSPPVSASARLPSVTLSAAARLARHRAGPHRQ